MPECIDYADIPGIHRDYRDIEYPNMTDGELMQIVCNQGLVLPQNKVGNVEHIPCCWLGDEEPDALTPEQRNAQARLRRGWTRKPKYLLVLPFPDDRDVERRRALHPATEGGIILRRELENAGIDLKDVMVSYACRFALPRTVNKYMTSHRSACLPYLIEDIYKLQPDVIIACGADSLKALYGAKTKLDSVRGNVLTYQASGDTRKVPVVPTVSHLAFLGSHANLSVFQDELRTAKSIVEHSHDTSTAPADYRVCSTVDEVEQLCADIREAKPKWIAFDTEFGNDKAREEHTYTLSLQFSWGPGKAAFVKLRDQTPQDPYWEVRFTGKPRKSDGLRKPKCKCIEPGLKCGVPMHTPEEEAAIWKMLQELMLDRQWRIAAHHLRVDVAQFALNGYPIDARVEDGLDTMLIHHLLYGDEDQGLDHLVRKYLPQYGAYWMELEEWLDANSRRERLRYGYRDVPLDLLIPYAQIDADVTWQLVIPLLKELSARPRLAQLYRDLVAPTSLHLMDVERQGILIDEERRMELHDAYQPVYDAILEQLRKSINWPDFNPGSKDQMASLLFTTCKYRDKKFHVWEDGTEHPLPEGVRGLNLQPLFNTDKYPRDWADVIDAEEEEMNAPSTKAVALDLLFQRYPDVQQLRWLKHLSVIGKFLSSYLAPQRLNEYGVPEDGAGFHNNIHADGRVRTHLSQLTQTGRYTSKKANLQTKPKKQEAAAFEALVDYYFGISVNEYKERSADDYKGSDAIEPKDRINVPKFASCFIAKPGYCLIEADFATAELCIWAYVSGDPELIKVVGQGRDLHSEVCALSFQLPEAEQLQPAIEKLEAGDRKPYDDWADLIKSKYGALRVAAKSVNFGVMYGRGAGALAREINKVVSDPVTVAETQKIIDGIATNFPTAWKWLENNSIRAVLKEYIENAFGRCRYFQGAQQMSKWDQAAVRREAKNSPIQGTVADLLAQAGTGLYRLMNSERGRKLDMEILLPIHDAFLFEVKNEHVPTAVKVIEHCMATTNLLPGTEHHLNVDIEILPNRWSDKGYDPHKPGQLDAFMQTVSKAA